MNPEDLRKIISAYQRSVAENVQRYGGFVAKYLGDGILVYFDYPEAHEDDAERAVRAGLELIAAVSALKTPVPCGPASALPLMKVEQANRGLAASSEIGDRWCLPRIYMTHDRLLQQSSTKASAAGASLRKALEVAGLQCAKGWELRDATSLAQLLRDQGKPDEAYDVLAPVYGPLTERLRYARS